MNKAKGNSQETWKTINLLLNKSPNLGSKSISTTKCNEYFTNIGPHSNLNWKLQSYIHNFKFKNISSDFVLSNLKMLGDESNLDLISLGIGG